MEMSTWLADLFVWIESTRIGELVRRTPYLYPVLESLHVLGIAILVGPALAVDLRLLGIARDVLPVTVVTRYLLPLSHIGFGVVAVTGAAMFSGVAVNVSASAAAPWKLGLIIIAGANILLFHNGVYRSVSNWDVGCKPPPSARLAGLVSALTWTGVIIAGRFIAY